MSLKKKLLTGLTAMVCAALCAFGIAACTPSSKPDDTQKDPPPVTTDTTFETGWTKDDDYHWHAATDGSGAVDGKAMHEWQELTDKTVAASCSSAGYKEYKCSVCSATKEENSAQLEHKWSDTVTTEAASCTTQGREYIKCTNSGCDAVTGVKFLPALGHNPTAATCTAASTCQREGCNVVVAPALGHEYAVANTVPATCTAGEVTTYACTHTDCTESYTANTSAAKGHKIVWSEDGTVNYLHTADVCYEVEYEGRCANADCAHVETKKTQVNDHVFSAKITTEATCTAKGVKTYTCACSYTRNEEIAINTEAHTWDEGTLSGNVTTFKCAHNQTHTKQSIVYVEKAATVPVETLKQTGEVKLSSTTIALDEGVKNKISGNESVAISAETVDRYELDLGQENEYVGGDAKIYNLSLEVGGSAVSELGGYVTVTVPYELGADEDPDNIIIWYINGDKLEEVSGTYANGFVTFKTNHFSYYTVTRMTPAQRCAKFGHLLKNYSEPATCVLSGYELSFCSRCGQSTKITLPALGHVWNTAGTAATCTAAGETVFSCKNCTESYTMKVPAQGHEWEATEYVAATCSAEGHASYKCANCTETYSSKFAQLAHTFKTTTIAPTCTEVGYKSNVCLACGHETESDHVAALGHKEASKVVAATCTVDGFTLKYCETCGQEIAKSNVTKATGHNKVNGTCTVCGEGCTHKFVAGTPVPATCTEDGYTPYECSLCKIAKKDNVVKATGHRFEVDACAVCGLPAAGAQDFYLNFIKTTVGGSVSFTLNNVVYTMTREVYKDGVPDEKATEKMSVKQLEVTKLSLEISPAGEIRGTGSGKLSFEIPGHGDLVAACKFAVADGKLYAAIDSNNANITPDTYIEMSLDAVLNAASNGAMSYEKFREYVRWYNGEVSPILSNLVNTNAEAVAKIVKFFVDNAFVRTTENDGYSYKVNFDAVKTLNAKLYETKISALADKLLGEGVYAQLPTVATAILNCTPELALEFVAKYGLDKDQVCAAVDSLYLLMTGQKLGAAEMLEEMLKQATLEDGTKLTVADFLMQQMGVTGVTKEEFVGQTVTQIQTVLSTYGDMTVYEVVAAAAKLGEAKDLYDMVDAMIEQYLPMVKESADMTFKTDKEGNVKQVKFAAQLKDLVVADSSGGNSDAPGGSLPGPAPVEPKAVVYGTNREVYKLSLSADVTIDFDKAFTVDESVIGEVKAAKPVFEKNAVLTTVKETSDKEFSKDDIKPDAYFKKNVETTTVVTDAKGNIVKVTRTRADKYVNVYRISGNYYACYEQEHSNVTEYDITDGFYMVGKGICGNVNAVNLLGEGKHGYAYYNYERIYSMKNHELVSETLMDGKTEDGEKYSGMSGTYVYYDSTAMKIVNAPHGYDDLKLDEANSELKCGGFKLYVCPDGCGYFEKRSINHITDERVYEYKLDEGSKTCEDGVTYYAKCAGCGEVISSRKYNTHVTYKQGEIDLREYGAKCAHKLYLYGCACRQEKEIRDNIRSGEMGELLDSFVVMNRAGYIISETTVRRADLYTCEVSDCKFMFFLANMTDRDENCLATVNQYLVLGVRPAQESELEGLTVNINNYNGIYAGGTEYKNLVKAQKTYSHSFQSKSESLENGMIEKEVCRYCGLERYHNEKKTEEIDATTSRDTHLYTRRRDDGTVEYSYSTVKTTTRNAAEQPVKIIIEEEYDYGEKGSYNKTVSTQTITYKDGKRAGMTDVQINYERDGSIINRTTNVTETFYVEGYEFEVMLSSLNEFGFFDEKGNPAAEPSRWEKTEYDYSQNRCQPTVTRSSDDGESRTELGEVNHFFGGDVSAPATCTQYGKQVCLVCHTEVEVEYMQPRGHEFMGSLSCERCGLKNVWGDGPVVLEDLSYTSESNYVLGYYYRANGSYSFMVSLINLEAQSEADEEIMLNINVSDSNDGKFDFEKFGVSGKVSFAIADIVAAAKENKLTAYMVRLYLVPGDYGTQLDYSITIDVHDWKTITAKVGTYGNFTDKEIKYCATCGTIHGVGYVAWRGESDGETTEYSAYSIPFDCWYYITLTDGVTIKDFPPTVLKAGVVLNTDYRIVEMRVDGNIEPAIPEIMLYIRDNEGYGYYGDFGGYEFRCDCINSNEEWEISFVDPAAMEGVKSMKIYFGVNTATVEIISSRIVDEQELTSTEEFRFEISDTNK